MPGGCGLVVRYDRPLRMRMRSRWELEELNMAVITDEDNLRPCEAVDKRWWVGRRHPVTHWRLGRMAYSCVRWLIYEMRRICAVRRLSGLLVMTGIRHIGINSVPWHVWRTGIRGGPRSGRKVHHAIRW